MAGVASHGGAAAAGKYIAMSLTDTRSRYLAQRAKQLAAKLRAEGTPFAQVIPMPSLNNVAVVRIRWRPVPPAAMAERILVPKFARDLGRPLSGMELLQLRAEIRARYADASSEDLRELEREYATTVRQQQQQEAK